MIKRFFKDFNGLIHMILSRPFYAKAKYPLKDAWRGPERSEVVFSKRFDCDDNHFISAGFLEIEIRKESPYYATEHHFIIDISCGSYGNG